MHTINRVRTFVSATVAAALAAACGGSDSTPPPRFEITLTNLTAGQPLSPPVVIAHTAGFSLMSVGAPASLALERLAEGAETAALLALAQGSAAVHAATASSAGAVAPGQSAMLALDVPPTALASLRLSLASMLVNSNDGFAALDAQDLSTLPLGQSVAFDLPAYDSGTEANTESADTVPGPAAAGGAQTGFDASRDDVADRVHAHAGVVSADDGLAGSALAAVHRWDNPVARLQVRRVR